MVWNSKKIILISSAAIFSRFLGLGRDLILAWVLGSGADALSLALRIPHFFRRLLAEGSLSLNYTSALIQKQKVKSFSLALILFFAGLFIFAEYFMQILAWGMEQSQIKAAASYFRLALAYCFFALLASQCMAKLHSKNDFTLSSFSPALFNIVSLSFLGIFYYFFQDNIYYFSLGAALTMSLAGLAQYLALYYASQKYPAIQEESVKEADSGTKNFANIFLASSLQINFLVCACLASFLPSGTISALFYAEKIIELPMSILALALTWLAAVDFNQLVVEKNYKKLSQKLSQNISLNLALALPACFGLLALSPEIVRLLFMHGNFDSQLASHTASALQAYAPCLILNAILAPLIVASRALNLPNAKFTFLALSINLVSGLSIVWGKMQISLAFSVSLALLANVSVLYYVLKSQLSFSLDKKALTKQLMLSIFIFILAKSLAYCFSDLIAVVLSIAIAIGFYFYATKDFWLKHDIQNNF